eukprot:TRINITY_DN51701_c0_g1_i1.p2 TRINITY_DN51701_c0_g1~~TRINITY_DN51701_c0_g1_i1.p2  ORF type:complete len:372 (+),score=148.87 TRINITY_DN51701_c0_g1_i1:82-1116(+)
MPPQRKRKRRPSSAAPGAAAPAPASPAAPAAPASPRAKRRRLPAAAAPPAADSAEGGGKGEEGKAMLGDVGLAQSASRVKPANKQKTLVFASRGITRLERHFLMDLRVLLPHHKAESKLDEKKQLVDVIPELCALRGCNSTVFFENRKRKDLYMWVSQVPDGPTAKFLISNVHTMDELKMPGNCLKGSRPILHFDQPFQELPELQVIRALLTQTFGTPRYHPNSKPFIDHVFSFYYVKGRIWFRNYEIKEEKVAGSKEVKRSLLEIGPRFVMQPIRVWDGCFEGRCVWHNTDYVTPNRARADARQQARQFVERKRKIRKRGKYTAEGAGKGAFPGKSPVDKVFR